MRADHRHELKTNELADWLMNLPDWLRENRTSLIATAAVIVVAVVVYFWIFYQRNIASTRTQVRLTNLVTQLPRQKADIAQAMAKQTDQSYLLIDLAKDLQDFAQSTSDREMSALALIERGDTLRSELHYRSSEVGRDDLARQIGQAQASYEQALKEAEGIPALAATAQLGLGLCEEELGNTDKAKELYRTVAENAAYDGTAAKAAAANRLKTMDDYQGIVVFKPAPPPQTQASAPSVQITPGTTGSPVVIPVPMNPNPAPAPAPEQGPAPAPTSQTPAPAPEAVPAPAPTGEAPETDNPPAPTPVAPAPEANSAAGG
ncbi:MAG: tetratricopeptide repeat protein [Sedimentisphaerales bacterium]|nr:tetratricopeptide repeat protein [Sedimentisphaerales bacterium]